jgi:hypothetical protein
MGKFYKYLINFIEGQHMFFVSSCLSDGNGHVNFVAKGPRLMLNYQPNPDCMPRCRQ